MPARYLIVDDNEAFLRAATALLEKEQGAEVVATPDVDRVASLVLNQRPDVVLIDVTLGPRSGFDVAGELAATLGADTPPLILISTYSERDLQDLIAASPAAGFLAKADLSVASIEQVVSASRGT